MTLHKNIHIKLFTIKDAHLFSKLRREIEEEADCMLAKKGERKEGALRVLVKLLISQRRTVTFLAYDGKKDIGYISVVFPKFSKLKGNGYRTIALREKYRGQGRGNMLMEISEKDSKERGVRRMELEVFGKNTHAIELYKKRGYEIEGIKKEAIQSGDGYDDLVIMAKRLIH